jgi:hypothetical protein
MTTNNNFRVKNGVEIGNGNVASDNYINITAPAIGVVSTSTGDIDLYTNNFAADGVEVWLRHNQDVQINTANGVYSWRFDRTGTLTFPDNTVQTSAFQGTTNTVIVGTITLNDENGQLVPTRQSIGTDYGQMFFDYEGGLVDLAGETTVGTVGGTVNVVDNFAKFGTHSILFDQGYVHVDGSVFNIGTADWTWDSWCYFFDNETNLIVMSFHNPHNFELQWDGASALGFALYSDVDGGIYPVDAGLVTKNTWHHIVVMRKDNLVYVGVDGVMSTGYSMSANIATPNTLGWSDRGGYGSNFYMDMTRWTGSARYMTTGYTVPTESSYYALPGAATTSSIAVNDVTAATMTANTATINSAMITTLDGPEGSSVTATGFRAGLYTGNGYSFKGDSGFDSGMFSTGDGLVQFYANSQEVANITTDRFQFNKSVDLNGNNIVGGSYQGNTLSLPVGGGATLTSGYEGGVTLRSSTDNTAFKSWNFDTNGVLALPAPTNIFGIDAINNSYTLNTNDTITFATFSGDIVINDQYDGFVYKFLVGSGVAMMYGDTNQYARGLGKTVTVGPGTPVGIEDYVTMEFTGGNYVFTNLASDRIFTVYAVRTRASS